MQGITKLLPFLALLASTASAKRGSVTHYSGNLKGGMCSFSSYTLPQGIYGTALSSNYWENSLSCGGCMKVQGPTGAWVTAMVVDQCPGGCAGHDLDLFENAFVKLAPREQGIVTANWNWIPCPITSPIQIRVKEGSSPHWFSAQAVNANKRVSDLLVSTDGGRTWKGGLTRQDYNFFQWSPGFGTANVDVKVKSIDGQEVVVKNCAVGNTQPCTGTANFN